MTTTTMLACLLSRLLWVHMYVRTNGKKVNIDEHGFVGSENGNGEDDGGNGRGCPSLFERKRYEATSMAERGKGDWFTLLRIRLCQVTPVIFWVITRLDSKPESSSQVCNENTAKPTFGSYERNTSN